MKRLVLAVLLSGCADLSEAPELADMAAPPPPAPLAPAPCMPGSAFELGGRPFGSLQTAVDQAGPGDEVVICSGTVTLGAVTVTTNNFILRGETGDPADVVLTDGLLQILPGPRPRAALQGLTFSTGATVNVLTDARFTLADVVIRDQNAATGVLMDLEVADVDLVRVRVTNNRCESAIRIWGAPLAPSQQVRLFQVAFDHNTIDSGQVLSVMGAIPTIPGTLTMTNVHFEDNQTAGHLPLFDQYAGYRMQFNDVTIARNLLSGPAAELIDVVGGSVLDGLSVTDNLMDDPAVLWSSPGTTSTLQHAEFLRNASPYLGVGAPRLGPLGPIGGTLLLRDVDFGTGVNDNDPFDIGGCPTHLGVVGRGRISWRSPCP